MLIKVIKFTIKFKIFDFHYPHIPFCNFQNSVSEKMWCCSTFICVYILNDNAISTCIKVEAIVCDGLCGWSSILFLTTVSNQHRKTDVCWKVLYWKRVYMAKLGALEGIITWNLKQSKIEKVPRSIQGESSKELASSRNLFSTIGAEASPKRGILLWYTLSCHVCVLNLILGYKKQN